MAKKEEKNGLVEKAVETTADATQHVAEEAPAKEVVLNQPIKAVETPGHTTRAFRG
jgi:hypothetical protein